MGMGFLLMVMAALQSGGSTPNECVQTCVIIGYAECNGAYGIKGCGGYCGCTDVLEDSVESCSLYCAM